MGTNPGEPFITQPAPPVAPARRANPWKWIVLGCGGLVLLSICGVAAIAGGLLGALGGGASEGGGGAGGAGGSNSTAVTTAAFTAGQTANVRNWDLAVKDVERPGKDLVWSQVGNKSQAAGEWLVVIVEMKNTGNRNFGVNNHDFELRTAGGAVYNVSSDIGAYSYSETKGGQRIGGQVPPGVVVRYYIPSMSPSARPLRPYQ